ncbi:hypothetical protein EDC01DRAFT_626581 [Geopyxis carbonaria]|nr:hypothetical protein EDC01DRAFT_626581 [Geopyxis carbonaria]
MRFNLQIVVLPFFIAIGIAANIPGLKSDIPELEFTPIPESNVPAELSDPTGWTPLDVSDPELDLNSLKDEYPEINIENLRAITFKCATTTSSATSTDMNTCGYVLERQLAAKRCIQESAFGTKCTTSVARGTAGIGVCGFYGMWINCRYAAFLAAYLIPKCTVNGRIGGVIDMGTGLKIVLYRST